jgi:hypothetical protein
MSSGIVRTLDLSNNTIYSRPQSCETIPLKAYGCYATSCQQEPLLVLNAYQLWAQFVQNY